MEPREDETSSNFLKHVAVWGLCFSHGDWLSPFFYDSGHDLTHTLEKMEEQLLKFAVNVLFNRFDLLGRSPGRAAVAIYCDVVSGVGVHPLCLP